MKNIASQRTIQDLGLRNNQAAGGPARACRSLLPVAANLDT